MAALRILLLTFTSRFVIDFLSIRKVIIVTGSEKRYIVAHKMIFLYKRCCSKTRNIFYSLKKKKNCGLGIYNSLPTLTSNLRN